MVVEPMWKIALLRECVLQWLKLDNEYLWTRADIAISLREGLYSLTAYIVTSTESSLFMPYARQR